jgi:hypothetical protein
MGTQTKLVLIWNCSNASLTSLYSGNRMRCLGISIKWVWLLILDHTVLKVSSPHVRTMPSNCDILGCWCPNLLNIQTPYCFQTKCIGSQFLFQWLTLVAWFRYFAVIE